MRERTFPSLSRQRSFSSCSLRAPVDGAGLDPSLGPKPAAGFRLERAFSGDFAVLLCRDERAISDALGHSLKYQTWRDRAWGDDSVNASVLEPTETRTEPEPQSDAKKTQVPIFEAPQKSKTQFPAFRTATFTFGGDQCTIFSSDSSNSLAALTEGPPGLEGSGVSRTGRSGGKAAGVRRLSGARQEGGKKAQESAEVVSLRAELAKVKSELAASRAELAECNDELSETQTMLARASLDWALERQEKTKLGRQFEELKEALEEAQQEVQEEQARRRKAEVYARAAVQKVKQDQAAMDKYRRELELADHWREHNLRAKLHEAQTGLEERIGALQYLNSELQRRARELGLVSPWQEEERSLEWMLGFLTGPEAQQWARVLPDVACAGKDEVADVACPGPALTPHWARVLPDVACPVPGPVPCEGKDGVSCAQNGCRQMAQSPSSRSGPEPAVEESCTGPEPAKCAGVPRAARSQQPAAAGASFSMEGSADVCAIAVQDAAKAEVHVPQVEGGVGPRRQDSLGDLGVPPVHTKAGPQATPHSYESKSDHSSVGRVLEALSEQSHFPAVSGGSSKATCQCSCHVGQQQQQRLSWSSVGCSLDHFVLSAGAWCGSQLSSDWGLSFAVLKERVAEVAGDCYPRAARPLGPPELVPFLLGDGHCCLSPPEVQHVGKKERNGARLG